MPTHRIKPSHSATPPLPDETIERAAELVRRSGILAFKRLTPGSKLMFTVSALVAGPDGSSDLVVVQAALADPSVVDVARGVIAGIQAVA
jgi:hypothetical protein